MAEDELPQDQARSWYVYRIDDCAGIPVYIGKGVRYRSGPRNKRNAGVKALIAAGLPWNPIRVAENLTEAEAYAEEMRLIALGDGIWGWGPSTI
jgi:hypothetical protein